MTWNYARTLAPLARFRALTHLNMSYSINITNLNGLIGLPLKTLILRSCLEQLRHSNDLTFVDLTNCSILDDVQALFCPAKPNLKGAWLQNVPIQYSQIRALKLQHTDVYCDLFESAYHLAFDRVLVWT